MEECEWANIGTEGNHYEDLTSQNRKEKAFAGCLVCCEFEATLDTNEGGL
jgi:hypothetical protein